MAAQERTYSKAASRAVSPSESVAGKERGGHLSVVSPDDPRCAVRVVLDRVADKWTALIITILADGPLGYAEIRRSAAGISHKMLAQTLRHLERDGLVDRTVHQTRPVRVSYELTPLGTTIVRPLAALCEWATDHGGELVMNQIAYDHRPDVVKA